MNLVNLRLTAKFYWINVEPDGSECYQCGDKCLLKMFRFIAKLKEIEGMKSTIDTKIVMCESCMRYVENK